jgi:probable F420-dependent oxidoreductase
MTLRVGLGLFTGQIPDGSPRTFAREYAETLDLVELAERSGFDSAWVSEHHGSSDGYLPSLLPMLAAFAARTGRIALGTGVVLAPFHDPLRLAEDAAVVDQLSGGRLVLGLGIGWREEEFRMFGVPMDERARRTEETVEVLRRAWTGRRFSFEGRSFTYDRVRVTPPPARPGGPPIYLGGYADRAIRRCGRIADGYIADARDTDEVRRALGLAQEAAGSVGRDPTALALALMQNAWVVERGDAWGIVADGVAHQEGVYDAWDAGSDTPERDRIELPEPDEAALRRGTSAGTPAEVVEALRPLVEPFAGRRQVELIVRLHYPGLDVAPAAHAVELFAAEVMPALRALARAEPTSP